MLINLPVGDAKYRRVHFRCFGNPALILLDGFQTKAGKYLKK